MKILGYTGFHNAINFRRKYYSDLTEQEYRMCQGLDSAACIIVDGKLIAAAEEERFNGDKYTCDFPQKAINYCLQEAAINLSDIDYICHGFDYTNYSQLFYLDSINKLFYDEILSPKAQIQLWSNFYPDQPIVEKFIPVSHHLAHAASAFYPSGFEEAIIIVADGIGEVDSLSIFLGKQNCDITLLKRYNFFSSLGILYSQITAHLGFLVNSDEYKVMGLAPYGDPKIYANFFDDLIDYQSDGGIFIKAFKHNQSSIDKQTGRGFRLWLEQSTFPERKSSEPILQHHKDLAAALQYILEKSILHVANYWVRQLNLRNLCIAGGVALNCTANGRIMREKIFNNIYIPPAASDAGTAIGAALVKLYKEGACLTNLMKHELPYYGSYFSDEDCKQAFLSHSSEITYTLLPEKQLIQTAADYMASGKVIAWMQGRMEFGPRALGNRSILADPRCSHMRDRINALVKKRESFRPFAPAVKLEKAHIYFDIAEGVELPHMLYTVNVRDIYQHQLPAITHVDGSARVQTVNKNDNSLFWRLLDAFENKAGLPVVLNTSFNVKGQPIVRTALEAVQTLLMTKIDALFLGSFLVELKNK